MTDVVINSQVKDFNGKENREHTLPKSAVIGIGTRANYPLYDVGSGKTNFLSVCDVTKSKGRAYA